MRINEMVCKVHNLAREMGWWMDKNQEYIETGTITAEAKLAKHMLMVSELAEATEEVRNNKPAFYTRASLSRPSEEGISFSEKPEGESVELADCVIRIMDYFGFMGWDLEKVIELKHEYNKTRAFKHGGKLL